MESEEEHVEKDPEKGEEHVERVVDRIRVQEEPDGADSPPQARFFLKEQLELHAVLTHVDGLEQVEEKETNPDRHQHEAGVPNDKECWVSGDYCSAGLRGQRAGLTSRLHLGRIRLESERRTL